MSYSQFAQITTADTPSRDSFGRLRTSQATTVFEGQFTYDLQPLVYEQIISGSGAAIARDATNYNALMTFASTPTGGKAFMQSYQYIRYQPGKSQRIAISFNFLSQVANCLKFVGYSDGVNGLEFQNNGTTNQIVLYSGTTGGNVTVTQANWNLDKLDGTGSSLITLDISKGQILVIDFQALYQGRVRFGFDIGGSVIYFHQILNSNLIVHPYIQTANLPVRAGMTCTGTVSTTMKLTCCAVETEGGYNEVIGYQNTQNTLLTAASGTATHAISLRPKTTFNGITNRAQIMMLEIDVLVTGSSPVYWELVIGQAITGTTTFSDVNTTYSTVEYNTAGTVSGSPAIEIDSGYVASANQTKGASSNTITARYPLTLDASGAQRLLGTVSLVITGVGGASACQASLKWVEIR